MNLIAMLMLATDLNGQPLPDVVLLKFGADYCPPCQQMVPVLQRMEKDRYPVRTIDITEQPQVSRQYKVDRIPTLILLVEGQEVQRFVGLTAETELRQAMNAAARELDQSRQADSGLPNEPPASELLDETPPIAATNEAEAPRSGMRGMFDKMRRGLTGEKTTASATAEAEVADFRAQSPDSQNSDQDQSIAMQATVRVRLLDGKLRDVGTGTIIQSTAGQSTILTCAHIFQKVNDQAVVEVDVFQDGKVLKYPATVLGGDHESDVALLRIQNTTPLPTAPLALDRAPLETKEALFSIGCSNGDLPTRLNMNVIEVDRYEGPENILCTNDPAQGRSGGGLFDGKNRVVGICSAADRKAHEGLYTGTKPIQKLITQLKLDPLFKPESAPFGPSENAEPAEVTPNNPFQDQDNSFDEFFADETGFSEFTEVDTASVAPPLSEPQPERLPDPFDSAPRMTAAVESTSVAMPTEITVIIDSPDPAKGKQVIVIPKPSPWLLELLTGEKPAPAPTRVANTRDRTLSTTSARPGARTATAPGFTADPR